MPRVTSAEVREIIDIDSSITDITPFITAGNLLVTNAFSGDTQVGDATLREIERYIVAHIICSRDQRTIEEWAGGNEGVRVKYMGQFGKGLESTPYGQNALLLDFTGRLAKLGRKRASIGMIDYSTDV